MSDLTFFVNFVPKKIQFAMIRLSILIPVYNWDCTKLVNDLLEQLPEDAEIIIGNDKSTDAEVIAALQRISCLKQCRVYEPTENIGRSRIRNRIFDLSHGEWLLFVDCDTEVTSPYFVKNYLDAINDVQADAYCGGMRNTEMRPKGCELRWTYEHKVAQKLTKEYRNLHPYESLTTQNFMISRDAFIHVGGFLEEITKYGYEDVILIQQLKQLEKKIHHIENRLIHLDIDSNKKFLSKTREALRTLHSLPESMWPKIKITNLYHTLRKYKLHRVVALMHVLFLPITRRILCSRFVSIKLLQIYKIGYFCGL